MPSTIKIPLVDLLNQLMSDEEVTVIREKGRDKPVAIAPRKRGDTSSWGKTYEIEDSKEIEIVDQVLPNANIPGSLQGQIGKPVEMDKSQSMAADTFRERCKKLMPQYLAQKV